MNSRGALSATWMSSYRGDAALNALIIKFDYLRKQHAPCIDRWVRFALTLTTTRRLKLDFLPRGCYNPDRLEYDFPSSLLSAGTPAAAALKHLYLRLGSLRSPQPPGLINLVTLVLCRLRVTSEDLERFISSCHKLRRLKLERCQDLTYLTVLPDRLKRLRFLVVKHCWSIRRIDVSGSAIESLRFDGRNLPPSVLHGSVLGPAPEVTTASFNVRFFLASSAQGTDNSHLQLLSLAHLTAGLERLSLTLTWETKVVMTSPHMYSTGNRFRHLKRANLTMYTLGRHGRDDFLFVYPFLDEAPALEVLSLDLERYAPAIQRRRQAEPAGGYFRKDLGLPHHSLKAVDITEFDADLASLELVLHILEKARALRRLLLKPWGTSAWQKRQVREAIATYITPALPSGSGILQVK